MLVLPVFLVTMLLTAILGFLIRRGPKRAYWVGFAVFGWAYFIPIFFWGSDFTNDPIPISIKHVINTPLAVLFEIILVLGSGDWEGMAKLVADLPGLMAEVDNPSRFVVAWSLLGLVFASLGGMIGRAFSRNDSTLTAREHPSPPGTSPNRERVNPESNRATTPADPQPDRFEE